MGGVGFEPTKASPSDLQSDPFDRSGNPPLVCYSPCLPAGCRPLPPAPWRSDFPRPARSQRRDLNPQPVDYKSTALPIELRWPNIQLAKTSKYNEGPLSCNTDGRKNARQACAVSVAPKTPASPRPTSLPEWVGHPTSSEPTRHWALDRACPATTSPLPAKKHLPCELDPLSRGTLEMAVRWNIRRTAEQDAIRLTCKFPSFPCSNTKKIDPAWDPDRPGPPRSSALRTPAGVLIPATRCVLLGRPAATCSAREPRSAAPAPW